VRAFTTELFISTFSFVLALFKIAMKEGLIGMIEGKLRGSSASTAGKQPHSHD
jgi:hypothetical protein